MSFPIVLKKKAEVQKIERSHTMITESPSYSAEVKGQGQRSSVALHGVGRPSCSVLTSDLMDHQERHQQAEQLGRQEVRFRTEARRNKNNPIHHFFRWF